MKMNKKAADILVLTKTEMKSFSLFHPNIKKQCNSLILVDSMFISIMKKNKNQIKRASATIKYYDWVQISNLNLAKKL